MNVADHLPETLELTKQNEDRLDAFIASYVAAYFWRLGTKRSVIIGSLESGYMVTPYADGMVEQFNRVFGAETLNPAGNAVVVYPVAAGSVAMNTVAAAAASTAPSQRSKSAVEPTANTGTEASLVLNDSGNLHFGRNPWIDTERTTREDLEVILADEDGEPVIRMTKFRAGLHYGLRPADEASRDSWTLIASGCSNEDVRTYRVAFAYAPTSTGPVVSDE